MSQTTLTSFFHSRKRPATDEIVNSKNKIAHIERSDASLQLSRKSPVTKACDVSSHSDKPTASVTSEKSKIGDAAKIQVAKVDTTSEPKKKDVVFAKKGNSSIAISNAGPSKPVSTNEARKELSLGDIRKKLLASSRLAEIRATADRLSKQIKESAEKSSVADVKNLKEFTSIDVDVR